MLILFRWLSRWPLWLLHVLGACLGWLAYLLSTSYRARFDRNAAQAGIPRSRVRPAIAEAGRLLAELPYLWLRPPTRPLSGTVTWDGAELIHAAHAQGRGILFLTPHMGCFEVSAQLYAEEYAARHGPITVMYRPARKPWLRGIVATSRSRPGLATAPATLAGVRQLIRALRRGEAVGLLPDQVPPDNMGVWAPFFGRPAYTMTLASRLAREEGVAPLLAWCERLPHGRGYVIHLSAYDEAPAPGVAQAESAAAINRAMERLIRERPQQYLWGYDRYKTPRRATSPGDDNKD